MHGVIIKAFSNLLSFPLYSKGCAPLISLDKKQVKAVDKYLKQLDSGFYTYQKVDCLCGSEDGEIIVNRDRYGIPVDFILCHNCGLIRVSEILQEEDLLKFYEFNYRDIYNPISRPPEVYFANEISQGRKFKQIISTHLKNPQFEKVLEIGCGAGGILHALTGFSDQLIGSDFDEEYLKYGRSKGLDLRKGTLEQINVADDSIDLVILSHVVEHFIYPLKELKKINKKIKMGGHVLIEVPGSANLEKGIFPRNFQNIHLYLFHQRVLEEVFEQLGYRCIYGNENVTLLLEKVARKNDFNFVISPFKDKSKSIAKGLKYGYTYYHSPLNYYKWKRNSRKYLRQFLVRLGFLKV